jgi:hypothetical protein
MKLLKQITFFFIAIVFITITACKKYPDGPRFSLYTKQQRLCNGWDVFSFTVNGYDSTAYLKSQPFYGQFGFLAQKGDNDAYFTYAAAGSYGGLGHWYFGNNKTSVQIYCNYDSASPGTVGPYRIGIWTWDIMRLEKTELWLKTNYSGKEYFVKFKGN